METQPVAEMFGVAVNRQPDLHTFSINQDHWEAYDSALSDIHVLDGCPTVARQACCVPGPFTPCVVVGASCICWSVMARLINPYEEQPLPEFDQEALVVTATGLRGYSRPLEQQCCQGFYKPEKYVCGSSWEPRTLTWDNISFIELSHGDASDGQYGHETRRVPGVTVLLPPGKEYECFVGLGLLLAPFCFVKCAGGNIPNFTRLRIESKERGPGIDELGLPPPKVVLEVIGLQEDADYVAEVLKAEWVAGLRRSLASSEMDLTKGGGQTGITKRNDRTFEKVGQGYSWQGGYIQ